MHEMLMTTLFMAMLVAPAVIALKTKSEDTIG